MINIRALSGSLIATLLIIGCTTSTTSPSDSCSTDSALQCGGAVGYTCTDANILPPTSAGTCGAGTANADGSYSFCCGTVTNTCSVDTTLQCTTGTGYGCSTGDVPPSSDGTCSDKTTISSTEDGYCCTTATTGCAVDTTLQCATGSTGYGCSTGDVPPSSDGTCSDKTTISSTEDGYCCTTATTGACTADSSLTCMSNASGLSCTGGATPDTGLDCSDPVTNANGDMDYCCFTFTSTTCTQDDTVQGCTGDAYGFSCTGTDAPSATDTSLDCSDPVTSGSDTLYCCVDLGTTTCMQDDTVSCSTPGSFGFSCTGTDTPDQGDASLTCSTPTADPNGGMDYCCTQ